MLLNGPGVLISALAKDALTLRRALDAGVELLGRAAGQSGLVSWPRAKSPKSSTSSSRGSVC